MSLPYEIHDDDSSIALNWIMIVPILFFQFVLISLLVWYVILSYEESFENILYVIILLGIIGFGIKVFANSKYVKTEHKIINVRLKIMQKIKDDLSSKEFKIGLTIKIISVLVIFVMLELQKESSYDLGIDVLNSIVAIFILYFVPGFMIHQKLRHGKIGNRFNIIFFCFVFLTCGYAVTAVILQSYQEHIPPIMLNPTSIPNPTFFNLDISLLGFYVWVLPIQVILGKYWFKAVVQMAIFGSPSGTTVKDNKFPF